MVIYTIGHSTRSWDDFVTLLNAHAIGRRADVRTIPRSRRHPHFSTDAMAGAFERSRIEYRHFPGLGGLRKPRPDSRNSGWPEEGFRGYADYMETAQFASAITELIEWAGGKGTGAGMRRVLRSALHLSNPDRGGASERRESPASRRRRFGEVSPEFLAEAEACGGVRGAEPLG